MHSHNTPYWPAAPSLPQTMEAPPRLWYSLLVLALVLTGSASWVGFFLTLARLWGHKCL